MTKIVRVAATAAIATAFAASAALACPMSNQSKSADSGQSKAPAGVVLGG